jgi:rRNA maturation RNase YbeY
VGKQRIRALNKKFRKINRVTDILAFSMREGKDVRLHPEILGDVVICPEIAQKSARIYKTTKENEIYLYLVHGILHLLGYDDSSVMRRRAMEKEQTRILKRLTQKRKGAQKKNYLATLRNFAS